MAMLVRVGLALFLSTFVQGGVLDALTITSYAPDANVTCPNQDLVRVFSAANQSLHEDEISFISAREAKTADAWSDWIGDGSALGYGKDVLKLSENQPRVGVAVSGGSYRASLYGAGVVNALDGRNSSSNAAGTGGLLQVSSYLTGLSGALYSVSWTRSTAPYRWFMAGLVYVLARFPPDKRTGIWGWRHWVVGMDSRPGSVLARWTQSR